MRWPSFSVSTSTPSQSNSKAAGMSAFAAEEVIERCLRLRPWAAANGRFRPALDRPSITDGRDAVAVGCIWMDAAIAESDEIYELRTSAIASSERSDAAKQIGRKKQY